MKTRFWQMLSAALLALTLGATRIDAADDAKPTNESQDVVPAKVADPIPVPIPAAPAEPVKVIQPAKPGLPPVLDQVVRLSESGSDEKVIRAYVEKAAPPYRITGNEIVQLHDLGVSQDVIMALIEHSKTADINVTEVISPPAQTQLPTETNVATAPLVPPEASDFYEPLSPYGSWVDVPGYGWSWQPTVAVINPGWRPYCDSGDWLWSDSGWYWHSYYSWGWAPFHYGRWFCHENRGWLWFPDRVWGPSWVCWRNSASHCGWAPLPPGAHCGRDGLTFRGAHVGADFGFGLGAAHFTFVARDHFSDRHVGGRSLRGNDANAAFHHTTVVNNFSVGANDRVINHGIGRETIAAASHTPIREVSVRELPRAKGGNQFVAPDRVNRVGNSAVVFRPGAQISAVRNSSISTTVNRQAQVQPSTRAQSSLASSTPFVSRTSPQHLMPNHSRPNTQTAQLNRNVNAMPSPQMTPRFQSPAYARPAAPMQRGFSSAQNLSPRVGGSTTFARPAIPSGGTGSRGGSMSHGSSGSGHVSTGHR